MNPDSPSVLTYRNRYRNKSPVQTKYEALKDSIKTVGKEYCSESSICGLKHLVNDRTTPIERYAPDVKVPTEVPVHTNVIASCFELV